MVEFRFRCHFQLSTGQWECQFGSIPKSYLTPVEFTEFVTTIRQTRIKPNTKTNIVVSLPGTQPCKVEMNNIGNVAWGQLVGYLTNCEDSYQQHVAKLKPPPDGQYRNEHP